MGAGTARAGRIVHLDDHVTVDITELLDRAAHDAMRVYPDLDVSLAPAPTVIILGLPAGLRLSVDNAIANAVNTAARPGSSCRR